MKIAKLFFIFAFVGAGFFYFGESLKADSASVIINEIAWMGTAVNENDEWIELKNNTASNLDLAGWTLKAADDTPAINLAGNISVGGYFLLERTDDESVPNVAADQIYTGALGNSGEILELRDAGGNLVDKIDALSGWPAGDNTSKKTMERKEDGAWQTSLNAGGTAKAGNSVNPAPLLLPQDNNNPNTENTAPATNGSSSYNLGDVVINEFVSDPADGEEEWVELYNISGKAIVLDGWTIEEGSGAKTSLSGEIGISGENKFFIIEKPKGNLNNTGDIIILRDTNGNLIDQVSYGNWNNGNQDNNAPKADDPLSVARKIDGQNSFNNAIDFSVTSTLTKSGSNIIILEEELEIGELGAANYDYSKDIIISEILPNPVGEDAKGEFIELYNMGSRDVNLTAWRLEDSGGGEYQFNDASATSSSAVIKAGGYLVIMRSESKIALNNDSDSVKLYQPLKEKPIQTVKYKKAAEGKSYSLKEAKFPIGSLASLKYVWSEIMTPGRANEIKTANHPPVVAFDCPEEALAGANIVFDSSDTIDEDGDPLTYAWDFGDGVKNSLPSPEHAFSKKGNYAVKLAVSDGKSEVKKEKVIKVVDVLVLAAEISRDEVSPRLYGSKIMINELLPNPEGSDEEGEWIELYNQGQDGVNLLNWKIEDKSEKIFKFDSDFYLGASMFYLLERPESKISLNNSDEVIRFYDNLGELADEIEYEKAVEGQSFARLANGAWVWTSVLTPGEENVVSEAEINETKKLASAKTSAGKQKNKNGVYVKTTLENIKEFEAGDLVEVAGTVAVLPGIFGSQYFYIVGPSRVGAAEASSPGVQVYNYKKDFPDLKVGDYIEAKGELSMVNGETRLKTKTAQDMKIIEHKNEPLPEEISSDKLNDDYVGQLVKIAGEITEKKSSVIYLDDGLGEAVVQIKKNTGISTSDFNEGEAVAIIGIVSRSSSGLRILPRSQSDIRRENDTQEVKVLGASSESDEWVINARNKKILYYVLISLGGLVIIAGAIWWKKKKNDHNSSHL